MLSGLSCCVSAQRANVQPRAARAFFVVLELRRERLVGCNVLSASIVDRHEALD
jgi:hypothetical protein